MSAALDPLPAPSRPLGPASSEPPSLVAAPSPVSMAPAGEMLGEGMGEMGEPGGDRWEEDRERKRRRRSAAPVDYKALDAKMREEAEAKKRAEANGGQ